VLLPKVTRAVKVLFNKQTRVSLFLFALAFVPRVLDLDVFLTADEPVWIANSVTFFRALLRKNFLATYPMDMPAGVTTMWTGVVGLAAKCSALWLSGEQEGTGILDFLDAIPFQVNIDHLPFLRLPTVLITSVFVVMVYFLVSNLFGHQVALFSGILLALDPFFLAHSRVIHHDALVSTFMTLALLSFMVYLWESNSWRYLFFSGLCAGLAFLSKSSSLILVPFLAFLSLLVTICRIWRKSVRKQLGIWQLAKALVVWGILAGIVFFLLWPRMWVEGVGTLRQFIGVSSSLIATPHDYGRFFVLGEDRLDPGPLFYPVSLVYRLTPLATVGIVASLSIFVRHYRCSFSQPMIRMEKCASLILYTFTFIVFMMFGAKKSDRYLLPIFPTLDILTAVGLCELWRLVQQRLRFHSLLVGGLLVVILEGGWSVSNHPYYFTYYNPLLGGSLVAPHVIEIGWGEGIEQAAQYLNVKGGKVRATSWYRKYCFDPFFLGQSFPLTRGSVFWNELDYVVFYINQVQRQLPDPQFVQCFHPLEPEHIVRIKGIDYAWIYKVPKPLPDCALPLQHAKRLQFGDSILFLGYEVVEKPGTFDGKLRINLYWRALREMGEDYTVYLKLVNGVYHVWGQQDSRPYWDGLPTNSWKRGQVIGDPREIAVLPGTPRGLYQIEVILYDLHSGRTLSPLGGEKLLLGPVEVTRLESLTPESLDMSHSLGVNLDGKVYLLGYNIESGFQPGDDIHLTLFWQCLAEMDQDYTVFTHLIDEKQKIWGQKDSPPGDGFYPTSQWKAGEIVRDQYDILIAPEAPPGEYQIEVGMYLDETGERLDALEEDSLPLPDNRILLQPVAVGGTK